MDLRHVFSGRIYNRADFTIRFLSDWPNHTLFLHRQRYSEGERDRAPRRQGLDTQLPPKEVCPLFSPISVLCSTDIKTFTSHLFPLGFYPDSFLSSLAFPISQGDPRDAPNLRYFRIQYKERSGSQTWELTCGNCSVWWYSCANLTCLHNFLYDERNSHKQSESIASSETTLQALQNSTNCIQVLHKIFSAVAQSSLVQLIISSFPENSSTFTSKSVCHFSPEIVFNTMSSTRGKNPVHTRIALPSSKVPRAKNVLLPFRCRCLAPKPVASCFGKLRQRPQLQPRQL